MPPVSYKRIALIAAAVVAATLAWATARPWLESPVRFSDIGVILWPTLAFVLLGAVVSVVFLLLEHRSDRLAAILASWAAFIVFWRPDIWYISILPLFMLFWYVAARDIRNDLADRRKVRVSVALSRGAKWVLLGAFLMVSLGFYLLPSSRQASVRTVSQSIQRSLESAYENPLVEQQLAQLPPAVRAQFRRDVAQYVDRSVHQFLGPFGAFIPPFLAFGLFVVLWSVSSLFRELSVWLGTGLFWILVRTGFVKIEEEKVSAEVIKM